MKFGAQKQTPIKMIQNFPNLTRRTSAISEECLSHKSAPNHLILFKFCMMMKNHILITVT